MRAFLVIRRPYGDHGDPESLKDVDPVEIAKLARELRELAESRLGCEVVVDYVRSE